QPMARRGTYIALPTQATSDAMHARLAAFVNRNRGRDVEVALAHGGARNLHELATEQPRDADVDGREASVEGRAWFAQGRRELLAELGAGTVDQALLAVLPVRHFFVRVWGLAEKLVILDEVHAYDAYTGGLLVELVRWLGSLGSSVVVMSATLPTSTRRDLI